MVSGHNPSPEPLEQNCSPLTAGTMPRKFGLTFGFIQRNERKKICSRSNGRNAKIEAIVASVMMSLPQEKEVEPPQVSNGLERGWMYIIISFPS